MTCPRDPKAYIKRLLQKLSIHADAQAKATLREAEQSGFLICNRSGTRRDDLLWELRCVRRHMPVILLFVDKDKIYITIEIGTAGYAIPYYAAYAVEDYVAQLLGVYVSGSGGTRAGLTSLELEGEGADIAQIKRRLQPVLTWLKGAGLKLRSKLPRR